MTAGQRVIAQPAFQGRNAVLLLAAAFAVGIATGLVVPLVHLTPAGRTDSAATGVAPGVATAAWSAYRADERTLPVIASRVGDESWQLYRTGERAVLAPVGAPSVPWQLYRAGERQSLAVPAPASLVDASRLYRAGERGDQVP